MGKCGVTCTCRYYLWSSFPWLIRIIVRIIVRIDIRIAPRIIARINIYIIILTVIRITGRMSIISSTIRIIRITGGIYMQIIMWTTIRVFIRIDIRITVRISIRIIIVVIWCCEILIQNLINHVFPRVPYYFSVRVSGNHSCRIEGIWIKKRELCINIRFEPGCLISTCKHWMRKVNMKPVTWRFSIFHFLMIFRRRHGIHRILAE